MMNKAFDTLISTYNQLLSKCYDALDPNADQATRDRLREALGKFLADHKAEPKPSDSSGGGE